MHYLKKYVSAFNSQITNNKKYFIHKLFINDAKYSLEYCDGNSTTLYYPHLSIFNCNRYRLSCSLLSSFKNRSLIFTKGNRNIIIGNIRGYDLLLLSSRYENYYVCESNLYVNLHISR